MAQAATNVFDTVPAKRNLDFYEKNHVDPKKVTDFLDLTKEEISGATGVPKGSVRFDARIPEELKRYITELAVACEKVAEVYGGDVIKTGMWFQTRNPLLGNISPRDMIRLGRFSKLMRFIQNARTGERP